MLLVPQVGVGGDAVAVMACGEHLCYITLGTFSPWFRALARGLCGCSSRPDGPNPLLSQTGRRSIDASTSSNVCVCMYFSCFART